MKDLRLIQAHICFILTAYFLSTKTKKAVLITGIKYALLIYIFFILQIAKVSTPQLKS